MEEGIDRRCWTKAISVENEWESNPYLYHRVGLVCQFVGPLG
jgi:hypothetical protein